jgi:hypothetical protein
MADKKAGRPAKWSGPTTAIRVPEHLAAHLLTIARQLDTPQASEPSTTPETIAQGLAEGWIVPTAAPVPPYMVTSTSAKGTFRYIVDPPPDVPAEVWAKADRLLDEVCGEMSQKEHWLLLGRLVEEWGQKVPE